MTVLRLCLIGCGHMGRLRARAALAGTTPVALTVADALPDASERLGRELGVPEASLEAALTGDFDAFVLASSAPAHAGQLRLLARRGKPVFCEKPLAGSLAELDAGWPEIRLLEGLLQIGFNRRHDVAHLRLKGRMDAGEIGRPEQIRIVGRDHVPPRPDGLGNSAGMIAETSIHDLDKARWLMGEDFVEVMAFGAAVIDPRYAEVNHVDTVTIVLRTADGRQAIVQNGWRTAYGCDQRVEVFGSGGELSLDNPSASQAADEPGPVRRRGRTFPGWAERYEESFAAETTAFLETVLRGALPSPGLADGLAAQRLVDAARRALVSGRVEPVVRRDPA
ncbi:Gfo/Idh/MocA family protein [Prosthecomicrobium sp. N25]|uniref:Gfo/Idh/MocA family protein n=1 Tax=Prosthecomicrobium sp. N25 TaxID=3129254 RepID=UPI0030772AAC